MNTACSKPTLAHVAHRFTIRLFAFVLVFSTLSAISVVSAPRASANPSSSPSSEFAFDFNDTVNNTLMKTSNTTGPIPASADFSVETWVYGDTNPVDWQTLMVQDQGASDGQGVARFYLGFAPTTNKLHIGIAGQYQDLEHALQMNTWTHIAVTVQRNGVNLTTKTYVNGSLLAGSTKADWTNVLISKAKGFAVGTATDGGFELDGKMDQVKVWNGVLTEADIQTSMFAYSSEGVTGKTLGSHYDFNGGTGSATIVDRGTNVVNLGLTLGSSNFFSINSDLVTEYDSSSFNSDSSTITDQTANNIQGSRTNSDGTTNTPYGVKTSTAPPRLTQTETNKEVLVTGSSLRTQLNNSPYAISLFAWVRPTSSNHTVFQERDTGSFASAPVWHTTLVEMVNGKYVFRIWSCTSQTASSSTALNQWHHIGITYDGLRMRGYIDGREVVSQVCTRSFPTAAVHYGVGGNDGTYQNAGGQFKGGFELSSLQIYKAAVPPYHVARMSGVSTVTFKSNYAGGAADVTQTIANGTSTNLTANSFSRSGYVFAGWDTKPGGGGTSWSNGEAVSLQGDLTLYARWALAALTPTFATPTATASGFTVSITNYDAAYTWTGLTVSSGSVAVTSTSGATRLLTVTGLSPGASATITQTTTRSGYSSGSATVSGSALNAYTITYAYNNATGGNSNATSMFTIGGDAITLPTPTRTNFTFEGWYNENTFVNLVGAAGGALTPTASRTLHARWTQNSLYGFSAGSLTRFGSVTATAGLTVGVIGSNEVSRVEAIVPEGALPAGTVINFDFLSDLSRAQNLLGGKNYVVSMVVSWLAPDGTVPDTPEDKKISVTVTNDFIRAGAKSYAIINNVAREVGTATQNGTMTFYLKSDPEVVIVAPALETPTVTAKATSGQTKSIDLNWAAIANSDTYTVKIYDADGTTLRQSIESITATSLAITTANFTALAETTAYRFSVTAIADGVSYSNSAESIKVSAATGSVTTTFTLSSSTITTSAFEGRSVAAVITNIPSGGSYTYQWFRGSDTATLTAISLATSSSYTPTAADRSLSNQIYLAVRVVATISGANYTFTSPAIPVYTFPNATGASVTAPAPASRGTYTSGKYKVGQTVIGHPWQIMGTPWPTLTYQWWICNTSAATANPQAAAALATPTCQMATGDGNSGSATRAGGTNIYDLGNYGFSYVVTSEAAGKFLTFTATLANAATTAQGSVFTFTQRRTMSSGIIQSTPGISSTPTISGVLKVNRTLTAATVTATTVNSNATGKISYQWQRCTSVGVSCTTYTNISGATTRYYRTSNLDLNRYLRVVATATNNATTPDTTTASSTTSAVIVN
jgi:uncharacterized repeat protein (TIGR02543 family)